MSERWNAFWFSPIQPHIYALLRITLGLVGFLTLVRLGDASFWDLDHGLIADSGLLGVKAAVRAAGLAGVAGWILYGISLGAFLLMTIGFKSSFAVPMALITQLVQASWNTLPLSGAHPTMQSLLFCLMWSDTGSVWSVDAWLERRRRGAAPPPPTAMVAPLRLLRYQIAFIYLVTGLWKLTNPLWRDGSAVHYVLNTNVFHRFPQPLPVGLDWLLTAGTYATLGWELGFAFLLFWRPTRWLVVIFGVLMHLGILAMIEVGPFHFVMLAAYPAFLEPKVVRRLFSANPRANHQSVAHKHPIR